MVKEKIIVTKLAPRRFLGVSDAAKKLRVRPQSVYMFLGGWVQALGPKKRERMEIVDLTNGRDPSRGRQADAAVGRARPSLGD